MSAEDSPSCLLWLRLTLSSIWITLFIESSVFVFSFFGKFLLLSFGSRYAASCCWHAASALMPMAQMKPSSSRPTAVMIFL